MTSEAAPAADDATAAPQVDHFGIVVRDLAAALAFYRDALGCDVTDPVVREGQGITKAYVRFGNMQVELIAPTVAESPIKHVLEDHNASDFLNAIRAADCTTSAMRCPTSWRRATISSGAAIACWVRAASSPAGPAPRSHSSIRRTPMAS